MRRHTTVALAALIPAACLSAQSGAAISGRVVDERGNPLPGITILYNRVSTLERDQSGHVRRVPPFVDAAIQTGTDGRFSVAGLPPGEYYVCAQPPAHGYIGSCEWNEPHIKRVLTAGRSESLELTIKAGKKVIFRVTDTKKQLSAGKKLLLGIITPSGYYRRAELLQSTDTARTFIATVPDGALTHLFVDSDLAVRDRDGKILKKRQPEARIALSAAAETVIDLAVD